MDLIIELKITNVSDWAIIQPLLQRLKIHFVQKTALRENAKIQPLIDAQTEVDTLLTLQEHSPAIVWSAYDSPKAADSLLQLLNDSNCQ